MQHYLIVPRENFEVISLAGYSQVRRNRPQPLHILSYFVQTITSEFLGGNGKLLCLNFPPRCGNKVLNGKSCCNRTRGCTRVLTPFNSAYVRLPLNSKIKLSTYFFPPTSTNDGLQCQFLRSKMNGGSKQTLCSYIPPYYFGCT